jgi:hypothetical protein
MGAGIEVVAEEGISKGCQDEPSEGRNPKSEAPKSEGNPKSEIRSPR